jgi:hypothetical protein
MVNERSFTCQEKNRAPHFFFAPCPQGSFGAHSRNFLKPILEEPPARTNVLIDLSDHGAAVKTVTVYPPVTKSLDTTGIRFYTYRSVKSRRNLGIVEQERRTEMVFQKTQVRGFRFQCSGFSGCVFSS